MFYINNFIARKYLAFKLKKANRSQLKIYLDMDMVFYDFSFNNLNANFVYNEDDFYNSKIKGIPAFIKLQKSAKKSFEYFPNIDLSRLKNKQKYYVFSYGYLRTYATKSVATVNSLHLSSIIINKRK
jgi:hypothetical protein